LVGAGASQPLAIFRNLTRRGSILLSFEYRGHTRSTGAFDLDTTIDDTRHALMWATDYAKRLDMPLHGFATCYGAVAMAAQFPSDRPRPGLWSFNTISGLFDLHQVIRFGDFVTVFSRHYGRQLTTGALLEGIAKRAIDCDGDVFRSALQEYLGGVFPELEVERDRFEELSYGRADVPGTILQLAQARYLDDVTIPPEIPCNVYYGWHDDVMSLDTDEGQEAYRSRVSSLIPHANVQGWDIDHFGRGPGHDPVIDRLADKFEEAEQRVVPLDVSHGVVSMQGVHR